MTQDHRFEERRRRYGLTVDGADTLSPEFRQALINAQIDLESRWNEIHALRSEIADEVGRIDARLVHVDALLEP